MRKPPKDMLDRLGLTQRQWKQRKRADLDAVLVATHELRKGCAYTPPSNGVYISALIDQLLEFKNAWSQKEWGK